MIVVEFLLIFTPVGIVTLGILGRDSYSGKKGVGDGGRGAMCVICMD